MTPKKLKPKPNKKSSIISRWENQSDFVVIPPKKKTPKKKSK